MHLDWLDCYQDYSEPLPLIGEQGFKVVDLSTGEESSVKGMRHVHKGSFSTKLVIKVSGNRLSVSGNPSVYGRLDNLFGYSDIDDCFTVYNRVLQNLGLPAFTKCTKISYFHGHDGTKATSFSDGAVVTRIDCTTNRTVGQGNELQYIRAVSMLPFGNAVPYLYTNGNTVDWKNKKGASLQDHYAKVYSKAHQMLCMTLFKTIRKYGEHSSEVSYIRSVIDYCLSHGVCRFEQGFRSGFLRKHNLAYWGLSDFSQLQHHHDKFLNIDHKLQVTAMDIQTLSQLLISNHIVTSTHAANCTAMYAINWMHGSHFDLSMARVKIHRARLRQIGIDIALPCDLSRFSFVQPVNIREIETSILAVPDWYELPRAA